MAVTSWFYISVLVARESGKINERHVLESENRDAAIKRILNLYRFNDETVYKVKVHEMGKVVNPSALREK